VAVCFAGDLGNDRDVSEERPTYQELVEQNAALQVMVGVLRAEVAELRARLGANSKNSSRPPSSDGLGKPAPVSLRRASGRRPGGQPGHRGATLMQVADPDEVIVHAPGVCAGCGAELGVGDVEGIERRQVFDLPEITLRVVEHQIATCRCHGCGARTPGEAPAGVNAPAGYGPRIKAVMVYLYSGQFLSKDRTAIALAELFDTPVSSATVASAAQNAAEDLSRFTTAVAEQIAASPVVNFDETGLRTAGKLAWVHSASTPDFSLLTCDRKRGRTGMDAAGVLPAFTGIAVHDAWAPYDTYEKIGAHQLCGAHVLRELQGVQDASPPGTWCWAQQAADALVAIKALVDVTTSVDGTLAHLDTTALSTQRNLLICAATIGAQTTAARTDKLMAKHHALATRIITRIDDYLRFTTDPDVPFDNNAAEREVRMIKLRQKVSGCLRTLSGAQQFCAIRTYIATTHKHHIPLLHALTQLTNRTPWQPQTS